MRKAWILLALLMVSPALHAGRVAVFYESEDDVKNGRFLIGTAAGSEIVISLPSKFSMSGSYFAAPVGEPLKMGTLSRLDNEIKVAVIKMGDVVANQEIQNNHNRNSERFKSFLPSFSSESGETKEMIVSKAPSEPYIIRLNGQETGAAPVALKAKRGESQVELELVRTSTVPVWRISLLVQSEPPVSFWLKEKERSLRDVPTRKLEYDHQILFNALASGRSVKIPIEVFFIKEESYTWTVRIESKADTFVKAVPIRFEHLK